MRHLSKTLSYLFHPLFIPFFGTFLYFRITPKYAPLEMQSGNILPIFILTIIIPIISYLILRNLGMIQHVFLPTAEERKYPIFIHMILLGMVVLKVIPNNYSSELYFFFIGLILADAVSFILLFFNKRLSMHMIGIASLLMFLFNLSVHFEKNIVIAISLCTFLTGLIAMARLYLKAHGRAEVFVGLLVGLLSQLLTVQFWM